MHQILKFLNNQYLVEGSLFCTCEKISIKKCQLFKQILFGDQINFIYFDELIYVARISYLIYKKKLTKNKNNSHSKTLIDLVEPDLLERLDPTMHLNLRSHSNVDGIPSQLCTLGCKVFNFFHHFPEVGKSIYQPAQMWFNFVLRVYYVFVS